MLIFLAVSAAVVGVIRYAYYYYSSNTPQPLPSTYTQGSQT